MAKVKNKNFRIFKEGEMGFSCRSERNKIVRFGGMLSIGGLVLMGLAAVFPLNFAPQKTEAAEGDSAASNTTINITTSSSDIVMDVYPTVTTGTFVASPSPIAFTVLTDNYSGYQLSLQANTSGSNAGNLINGEDNSTVIRSIASVTSAADFSDTGSTGQALNNMWGVLPSKYNSTANVNYVPAPNGTAGVQIDETTEANTTANNYTIGIGTRVGQDLPAGSYANTFVITAVGKPINYEVTYAPNALAVTNMPANQGGLITDISNGEGAVNTLSRKSGLKSAAKATKSFETKEPTVRINNDRPKRAGYTLKGWCAGEATSEEFGDQTCVDGDFYRPGDEYVISQITSVNTLNLTAVWWQPDLAKLDGMTMQDMSPMACENSVVGATATLTDNRGGVEKSYTVTKMADGVCWMTTNLNLGAEEAITLTAYDTDVVNDFVLPATGGWSANNAVASLVNDATYGGYYSWPAATADETAALASPATSICPKNWDLPSKEQYANLSRVAGIYNSEGASAVNFPYDFVLNGSRVNGNMLNVGAAGYLWTSTYADAASAYQAHVSKYGSGTYRLQAEDSLARSTQAAVRCVGNMGVGTVIYDANGGSGTWTAADQSITDGLIASGDGVSKAGAVFTGWNTAANGNGKALKPGELVLRSGLVADGTTTLYAQWSEAYTIVYDGNGATSGNMTNTLGDVYESGTATLSAPNFRKDGYGFAGWSAEVPELYNDEMDMTDANNVRAAHIYGPMETITIDDYLINKADGNRVITLHAVWIEAAMDGGVVVDLQGWGGCSNLTAATYTNGIINPGGLIGLTDSRDGNVYVVARLEDGNCWTLENLKLDNSAVITGANTNRGVSGFALPASSNDWCVATSAECNDKAVLNTNNTTDYISNTAGNQAGNVYAYGNYYNWYAATAGNGLYSTASGSVSGDVCPAGWQLPVGGSGASLSGSFAYLDTLIGGNGNYQFYGEGVKQSLTWRAFPHNLLYAGYQSGTDTGERGVSARYWTNTANSEANAYGLSMGTEQFSSSATTNGKYSGFSVRCVLRNS